MSATTTVCTCGAPLVAEIDFWLGECSACGAPPSLEVPFPRSTVFIAGVAERARGRAATKARDAAIRAENRLMLGADFFEDDVVDLDEPALSTTAEVQAALVEFQSFQRNGGES